MAQRATRLQDRIVVFFVGLLMAVLLASFWMIHLTVERTAQEAVRGKLQVGARVFQRLQNDPQTPGMRTWDEALARDRKFLTSTDITFLDASTNPPTLLATTVPSTRLPDLLKTAPEILRTAPGASRAVMMGEEFEVVTIPLEDPSRPRAYALLQLSVAEGLENHKLLRVVMIFLAALCLGVTLLGSIRIARRITRPIATLAAAAREIERGNYAIDVPASGSFEIDELASAFSGMARGLVERDTMRDILGKVSSPQVAEQLLKGEIELGGAEIEASVIFTDVRNFTALAETLTPTQSLGLLNEFLTEISRIVEQHEGVVDKYIGDGVMAVFGAPVPRAGDTQRSVMAAIAIRNGVRALGVRLAARGLPNPEVGCGLNTSNMIAGNIGSPERLNYTVLGDGVNLAARLEGLTKRYHVPIVAGERVRDRSEGFVWRELDRVRVRGRVRAERIFEPLCREGELPAHDAELLAAWHAGLEDFRARRWTAAKAVFESLHNHKDYVRLGDLYLGYIRDLTANPPGPDWDAAFTLYEK